MNRRNRGVSLIECLVFLSIALIVTNLGGLLIAKSFYLQRQLNRDADAIAQAMRAGERWRQDVRAACNEPVAVGTQIWLPRLPADVSWRCENGVLERGVTGPAWEPVLRGVAACEWSREDLPGLSVWRMELELAGHHDRRRGPAIRFTAVWPGVRP